MASPDFYKDYPEQEKPRPRGAFEGFLAWFGIPEPVDPPVMGGGMIVDRAPSAGYVQNGASLNALEQELYGHMTDEEREKVRDRVFRW